MTRGAWIVGGPVAGEQRNAPEVQHREDVRVRQLVLQAEADDLKIAERGRRLERCERQTAGAELGFHVDPGCMDALAVDVRPSVQDIVEDLQAEVGLRDLVHLGEGEGEAQADARRIFPNRASLVAEIPPRLVDETEELFVGQLHVGFV
jgi:hypothetical protein